MIAVYAKAYGLYGKSYGTIFAKLLSHQLDRAEDERDNENLLGG